MTTIRLSSGTLAINRDICITSGACVNRAPNVFTQNEDDGLVELLADDVISDEEQNAIAAARQCPSGALKFLAD